MAKKKPSKKTVSDEKETKKPKDTGKPAKTFELTPRLTRNWLKVKRAWIMGFDAFHSTLSLLSDEEAEEFYLLVIQALYKGSYVEILRANPKLRAIVKNDDDRLCMHDAYEKLSWRLNRREERPSYLKMEEGMRGIIGRNRL